MAPRWRFAPRWRLDGASVVADVGPQVDDVGDELGREAREDLGKDRRQARGVRSGVALP